MAGVGIGLEEISKLVIKNELNMNTNTRKNLCDNSPKHVITLQNV